MGLREVFTQEIIQKQKKDAKTFSRKQKCHNNAFHEQLSKALKNKSAGVKFTCDSECVFHYSMVRGKTKI